MLGQSGRNRRVRLLPDVWVSTLPKISDICFYLPFMQTNFPVYLHAPQVRWDASLERVIIEEKQAINRSVQRLFACKMYTKIAPVLDVFIRNVSLALEKLNSFDIFLKQKTPIPFSNSGAQKEVWKGLLRNQPDADKMAKMIDKLSPQNILIVDLKKPGRFAAEGIQIFETVGR